MTSLASPEPWNQVSAAYADGLHHHLALYAEDALRLLAPRPTDRVLDVGCGAGAATLCFAQAAAHVTAVDFSPGMIQALQGRLRATGTTNITALEGDGQALVLPDGHADLAVSMFSLFMFPDRGAGLRELYRCLRPGGRAAVSCWPPSADSPAMRWMTGAFAAGFPGLPSPPPPTDALDNTERLEAELEAAGFVDIELHELSHDIVIEDIAAFWAEMRRSSAPAALIRARFSDEAWEAGHRAAVAHLQAETPPPLRLPMPALLGTGRRPRGGS